MPRCLPAGLRIPQGLRLLHGAEQRGTDLAWNCHRLLLRPAPHLLRVHLGRPVSQQWGACLRRNQSCWVCKLEAAGIAAEGGQQHVIYLGPNPCPLHSMDKLKQAACCHIYSARDYTLEGSGSEDGGSGPGLFPRKGDPLMAPPSPSAMAR